MGDLPGWWQAAFARLVEVTPARIVVLHARGDDAELEWANPAAEAALGLDAGAMVGRSIRELYPPAAVADLLARIAVARDEGLGWYETVRDLPDGRQSVRVTVIPLDDDRVLLFMLDVSGEREAQRRLDAVMRTARIGVYQWNVVDGDVWWSDELCRILGVEPADTEPTIEAFLDRVHPDDLPAVAARTETARRDGVAGTVRHRIVTSAGLVRTVEGRSESVTDDEGRLVYLIGTVQDVTERRELEHKAELLRQAATRQHTALEVHDTVVQGLSSIWLALELGDVDRAREATSRATASAQQVVADLLAEVGEAHGGIQPGDLVHGRPRRADR